MMPLLAMSSIQSARGAILDSPPIRRRSHKGCLGRENPERLAMTLDKYDASLVEQILRLAKEPPTALFENTEELMEWLDETNVSLAARCA